VTGHQRSWPNDAVLVSRCLGPYDEVATFNQQERITVTTPGQ